MGFYSKYIFPPILSMAMKQQEITLRRERLIPQARGRVLEVGIGPGLNLPFYGRNVSQVEGVDPSPELLRQAHHQAKSVGFPVKLLECSAEELPLESASVDTAVMTYTLCSIPHPEEALREIRRVLKPGGKLLFVEHGLAPEPKVEAWQHRLNPLWSRIAGGCNLDRKPDDLIRNAGFSLGDLTTGYMPAPRMMAWAAFMYEGSAHPA